MQIREKLREQIVEAHAMEQDALQTLEGMIRTTSEPVLRHALEEHRAQTVLHVERLENLLDARGASPSALREAAGVFGALAKLPIDLLRGETPLHNARDGFAVEHYEIAAYELLERLAEQADDAEAAAVARTNRADEEAMAGRIAAGWDLYVDLAVKERRPDGPPAEPVEPERLPQARHVGR